VRLTLVASYWTTAATKFGEEQRAAHHVERQGFEFYLPKTIEGLGARLKRDYLFPGYIFIKVSQGWHCLMHTRGIRRMFFCGESPTRMASSDIDLIRRRESADGFIRLKPPVMVGSKVTMKSGSFRNLVGNVESMTARDRCTVLLSIMERTVAVDVSLDAVEAVA